LFTPLHYAIIKTNYESFIFLVSGQCAQFVNLFAYDESFRTPRGLALINSPFYKVLVRLEKELLLKGRMALSSFNYSLNLNQRKIQRNAARLNGGTANTKSFDFNNRQVMGSSMGRYQSL
jgi:hypothetical protein